MRLAALASLLASLSIVAPASARTVLLGRSWQGRPIRAVEAGNASGTHVLVVGCIHGNETAGIAIARALERLSPANLDLWIVPDLNPDGVEAGTRHLGLRRRSADREGVRAGLRPALPPDAAAGRQRDLLAEQHPPRHDRLRRRAPRRAA